MSQSPDDPQLREFLARQPTQRVDADSPEMRQMFQSTASHKGRRPFGIYEKAGLGIVVVLIVARIIIKLLAN